MVSEDYVRTFYAEVGHRIRDARNSYPMTQENLARQLGLTRSSIANIEAGRQRIQLHIVAAIGRILNLDLHSLTEGLETDEGKSPANLPSEAVYEDETVRDFVRQAMLTARNGSTK